MKIKAVHLIDFGRLVAQDEQKQAYAQSPTGYVLHPATVHFVERTDRLKGEVGLQFGIRYLVEGHATNTQNEETVWECRIRNPPLMNPASHRPVSVTKEQKINYLNQPNFDYYHLEFAWEVQPGTWTFQLIENGRNLFEKTFIIT